MSEVYQVPTVEAYALMQQDARAKAAELVRLNKKLIYARTKTQNAAFLAETRTMARTVATARSEARKTANLEVDAIFQDEYTRERVRAFEAHPLKQKSYGDIEACAAEAAEYDKRHRNP